MEKFSIRVNGRISQRIVKSMYMDILDEYYEAKRKKYFKSVEIAKVWEFLIWYRANDEKDFIEFYSDKEDIDQAIQEAIEYADKERWSWFAIDNPTHGVVARYGKMTKDSFK